MVIKTTAATTGRVERRYHWIVAAAFFTLLVTGSIILVPALAGLASGSWSRLVHRVAAAVLVGAPLIYAITNTRAAGQWLRAAFNLRRGRFPSNPDTWKDRHRRLVAIGFTIFAISGALQWLFRGFISAGVFQAARLAHDIAFYSALIVLLFHLYHELQWWLWKKRYCEVCPRAYCAAVCPTQAISPLRGAVMRHPVLCYNCRLCMADCRAHAYHRRGAALPVPAGNR